MVVSISPIGTLGSVTDDEVVSEIISDLKESPDKVSKGFSIKESPEKVSKAFNIVASPDISLVSKTFSIRESFCTTVCAIKEAQVDRVKINPINRLIMGFKFDTSFVLTKILQFLC